MGAAGAKQEGEAYLRRVPESGVLYGVLAEHLETFLARCEGDACGPSIPRFVEAELRGYLACGILAHGFARVHCYGCGEDSLVAFSCKGRGFCPSCGGRRMAESAAHLIDHVLPEEAPVRQWVLSFPWALRYLFARDARACSAVRRLFLRAVFAMYRAKARKGKRLERAKSGAVNRIQRFGSALNLNVHFHALVIDGVYLDRGPLAEPNFLPADDLEDEDVVALLEQIRSRVVRLLTRRGLLDEEGLLCDDEDAREESLLPLLQASSVQGRAAQGVDAGKQVERIGRIESRVGSWVPKRLCAQSGGFSLHAAVRVEAGDRERLERFDARHD